MSESQKPKEFKYVFHGRVLPERADVEITGGPIIGIQTSTGYDLRISFEIRKSLISIHVTSFGEITDFAEVRNFLLDFVRLHTDSYGYIKGYAYDAEITSVSGENNQPYIIFGVGIKELTDEESKRAFQKIDKIILLAIQDKYRFIYGTLANLRLSIKYPSDTGTFCYRAVESIRQYFGVKGDSRDARKKAWEKLNAELNVDKSWTARIADFALDPRHGKQKSITHDERVEIMQKTWVIVDRFLIYAQNNEQTLDTASFPLLKYNDTKGTKESL
ncbi:hypothetical protein [Nitrosopumilus sp.]|uniref:hypothetical protein n=1 Tax=Nitrosopumilus sp. TaxID=2024843 RepID=UPI00247CAF50|nr:hypothetical protein [Nitrosopumilus sp.]MCV0411255.1 hypothetical protein [Nitrosopumilus sp.]